MGIIVSRHLSDRVESVMKVTGLSRTVVESVLKAEREANVEALKDGKRVVIGGICTITPYSTPDGRIVPRSRISGALKNRLGSFYAPEGLPLIGTISEDTDDDSKTISALDDEDIIE